LNAVKANHRRPRRIALRALAAALTLLLLGGQALATLHQLVVPHRLCAEHGHLIHAEKPAARSEYRSTQGPLVQTGSRDGDEHGHCALAVRRDELRSAVLLSNEACVSPPIIALATKLFARVEPSAGPPLFELAPKQSPPG
jgi:hypothetical protein